MKTPQAKLPSCSWHALLTQAVWTRATWAIRSTLIFHLVCLLALLLKPVCWPWLVLLIMLNHLLLALAGLWPRSRIIDQNMTRLPEACRQRAHIALTIDDGPDPLVTPQVLDILDRYGARATFFCIGDRLLSQPELAREIVRRGHQLENHSQHHWHWFACLGPCAMLKEVALGAETIRAITGCHSTFFRAPAGLRSPFLAPVLARLGYRLVSWTRRGFDTRERQAECVLQRLLSHLAAGDILLLHDGHAALTGQGIPVIVEVLPLLLASIQQAELHCVTLNQACQIEPNGRI